MILVCAAALSGLTVSQITHQIGPFIDSTHICVKNGDVDDSPIVLFRKVLLEPLKDLLDKTAGSIALLIPSVKDILNEHAAFPQSQLHPDLIDDPVRIPVLKCRKVF